MECLWLVTGLVALVLYLNTLDADFVYDDSRAIQTNPDLVPSTPLINILYDDFWGTPLTDSGSHKSYRPLCVLSFRLNYYLGELNPWGYHLGNVILHAVVTVLFTYLSRLMLRHTLPTLVSGLVFASHPVHSEAVAGVVGRADVGACLFFILSLISYIKYVHARDLTHDPGGQGSRSLRFAYFVGTAVMTTAGMLTKELGVTVIAVCAAYDIFVHNKMTFSQILQFYKQRKHIQAMEGVFLLGILGVSLVAFRVYFMGNQPPDFAPSDNPASDSDSVVTRFLTFSLLPVLNFWIFLCPRILSFDWSMESIPLVESVADYRNIFSLFFYSFMGYTAWYILTFIHQSSKIEPYMNGNGVSPHISSKHSSTYKHQKTYQRQTSSTRDEVSSQGVSTASKSHETVNVLILSLAFLVFPFIPAANLFFYVGFVIAERVLYIPSMGFCLLVGHGVHLLHQRFHGDAVKQKLLYVCVTVLLVMFGARTVVRNEDWGTEERLYTSGVQVNPAKAWGNLANIYNRDGKKAEAEAAYKSALHYRGNMADTHYNLGILLQEQGRAQEAVESYKMAIHCRPKLSMAHLNLAILKAELGEKAEAEKIYRHCMDLDTSGLRDPRLHDNTKINCRYNLGRLLSDMGRTEEALKEFKLAVERKPSHYAAHSLYNMYGEAFMSAGRYAEAEHWYREALKSKPGHIPAFLTMAKMLQKKGDIKGAESWFKQAKDLDANDLSIDHHYAQFLSDTGRLTESATLYGKLAETNQNNFEIVFNAANVLRQVKLYEEAEKLFARAAELKPSEASAHMNLGAILHMNGKLKESERSYLRALELRPDDNLTKQNLAKLRKLLHNKS